MNDTNRPTRLSAPFLGVGWRFPLDHEGAAYGSSAFERSARESIIIILSTARGERVMRPSFGCGIHELLFNANSAATRALAAHEVEEALRTWEPRIEILAVDAATADDAEQVILVAVEYRVRKTDNRFNLVYPFYLDRALR